MSKQNILFEPITIGNITLKNRFMRSATHEWLANDEGKMTDRMLDLIRTLAQGGVGLIIPGYSYIDASGKSTNRQGAIYDDEFIPGYRELVKVIHENGSKTALQVVHGGRQSKPDLINDTPMAPSAVEDTSTGIVPREMTEEDIEYIKNKFVEAALRTRKAGFDAVQLHVAHGFLLSEFISPYTNRRIDKWGGSTENRCRFIEEIITEIRQRTDNGFEIFVKLNSTDGIEGGLTEEESAKVASRLAAAGVSMIEVSGGMGEAGNITARTEILDPEQEAYFASGAKKIKAAVPEECTVALVGGLRSLPVMNEIVTSGTADMISLSRPFIREPDLVQKLKNGEKERVDCISCNGCYVPEGIRCVVINP